MNNKSMYREVEGSFEGVPCTYIEEYVEQGLGYVPVALKLTGEFVNMFGDSMLNDAGHSVCGRKVYIGNGEVSLWSKLVRVASCKASKDQLPEGAMTAWKNRGEILPPFQLGDSPNAC